MGNYHAPFGKRTMEKGLRQQVPRQRPTSLDGRGLETDRCTPSAPRQPPTLLIILMLSACLRR